MNQGNNPIPGGWCSDPSIVRVGEDYYIAASTFEWMPGVALFHSKDMIHWERLPGALQDDEAVNMEGIDPSCGIWAPNLTWCDGLFYLAYTIVYTSAHRYKDTHNFLITARDICGPWSKPVPLHRIGFDPSIFHDDDGRKYVVSQTMEYRTTYKRFRGVTVQEYDPVARRMVGEPHIVFEGTDRGVTEGPNIMKKDGWYYITAAEGGTEYGHCVTMARSRSLWGPYEVDPRNPMLSSTGTESALQRAGHGQYVSDSQGNWYMAHLCARPIEGKWSILGREAAIQNIDWPEGEWPRIKGASGTAQPKLTYEGPEVAPVLFPEEPVRTEFAKGIPNRWMTLRRTWRHCGISLDEREGYLRIHGGNSLCSHYQQGLLARNLSSLSCDFATRVEFTPRHPGHLAGLVCMYNSVNWYYLAMSADEAGLPVLGLFSCENGEAEDKGYWPLPENCRELTLSGSVRGGELQFAYARPGEAAQVVGPALDMRILSDEHVDGNGFTAAMTGICCQDLRGDGVYADFDWFDYRDK